MLQVHGDYYRRNLEICKGRVTALLDWDETRVDWRAWEVGRAIWEFCRTAQRDLDFSAARDFIETYCQAGGAILEMEVEAFVPLMKADILWGVLYDLGEVQRYVDAERGLTTDWAYQAAQLSAFDNLREVWLA